MRHIVIITLAKIWGTKAGRLSQIPWHWHWLQIDVSYKASVWSPHTQKNIKKLESIQRRSARYVMNDFSCHSSVTVMIQHLEWQPQETSRQQVRLMMFYCIIHDLVDISANPYLTPSPLTSRRDSSSQEHESRAISTPSSQPQ